MTERAFSLHEEVVAAMEEKHVDPMERSFHRGKDLLLETAKNRQSHNTKETTSLSSRRSTNLDFWKSFHKNVKFLEAKSLAKMKEEENQRRKRKKKTKGPKANSLCRENSKTALNVQDQRRPPDKNVICKFPPPIVSVHLDNNDGFNYGVAELMKYADKKNDKDYAPAPLEEVDPYASNSYSGFYTASGVSAQFVENDEDDTHNEERKSIEDKSSESLPGQHYSCSWGENETSQASLSDDKLRGESESKIVQADELGIESTFAQSATTFSSSHEIAFQESLTTNKSYENQSIISGTIVPSLNLSAVFDSKSSKTKSTDLVKDESQTAEDLKETSFVEQQSSEMASEGQDFAFSRSIPDGTSSLEKNASYGDDPVKNQIKKQTRRAVRKPLGPVKGEYGDIGAAVPGGAMATSPARPRRGLTVTQSCTFHSVRELDGARAHKGGSFSMTGRFSRAGPTSSGLQLPTVTPTASNSHHTSGKFSQASRFPSTSLEQVPGPGEASIQRLFEDVPEGKGKRITGDRAKVLVRATEVERMLRNKSCSYLADQSVFAYGCNVEEHIKYGLCLDGQCGRRSKWEDVTLLTRNEARLGHGGGLSPHKSCNSSHAPSTTSLSLAMSRKTAESIEYLHRALGAGDVPDFSPLKTASLRGDFATVVKLCQLGADINERDELHQTIMHQAVLRNYLHMIVCLTEVKGYSECLNDDLKRICATESRGMFRHTLDLDAQDMKGNTPLHIASLRGNALLAEALCDAGAVPDTIRNSKGQSASDVAKTQRLFQIIKMSQAKHEAKQELATLRLQRRRVHRRQRRTARETRRHHTGDDDEGGDGYHNHDDDDDDDDEDDDEDDDDDGYHGQDGDKRLAHHNDDESGDGHDHDDNEGGNYHDDEVGHHGYDGCHGDDKGDGHEDELEEKKGTRDSSDNKQHSYHLGYFGSPQARERRLDGRERYARFLGMRR